MEAINWVAVHGISEALGLILIVGSLIYVAIQVQQNNIQIRLNTDTAKVSAYHQAIEQITSSWMEPDFAILTDKLDNSPESLTSAERLRLEILWSATLFGHEITLELYKKGLIDPALWENMLENNRPILTQSLPLELLQRRPGHLARLLLRELTVAPA
jgi:hypothetical protein